MSQRIGYIRVSSKNQNLDRQLEVMQKYNVEKLFQEKISARDTNREQLKELLKYTREKDVVYVESYSRLARSTADLLSLLDQFNKKGVGFVSDKEQIDTTTPQGKLMMTIFAGLSQFERECMLERQREGIELARNKGKYKGKPFAIYDNNVFKNCLVDIRDKKMKVPEAMKILRIKSITTYYQRKRLLDKYGDCNYTNALLSKESNKSRNELKRF
jgi:DNA invertase Pin-like site-specific DNA recombinase